MPINASSLEEGLERRVSLFSGTNIVIANMIGAGIFTTSGLLMGDLKHPMLLLFLWGVGGLLALAGALSYGELGAAMPQAGGEYVFLARLYHPVLGFMSGWTSLFAGFSAPIAASAIGFAEYLTSAFPLLLPAGPSSGSAPWTKKAIAVLVIFVFTLLHRRGIRWGTRVQNFLTVLKISLIIGLIVAGALWGSGDVEHFRASSAFAMDLKGFKTLGLSLMWIMFAYSGWNAAAYLGAELREPARTLPAALLGGTLVVTVLYLGINVLFLYALPPEEMAGVVAIGGLAVKRLMGAGLETPLSAMIAFSLFSSLSAFMILGPRVYYAMAKDGYFFPFAAEIHPTAMVPSKSVVLQGVMAMAMVFLGTFDQILTYMGFALGIFPLLCIAGVFLLRRRSPTRPSTLLRLAAPAFYILLGSGILILSLLERPVEAGVAIVTVLAALPVYCYFRRERGEQAAD